MVDNDMDGVDDIYDKCLNTPFLYIVDETGCPADMAYYGGINLEYEYGILKKSDDITILNEIYIAYRYDNYLFNGQKSIFNIESQNNISDTYFNIGYQFNFYTNVVKTYIGVKYVDESEYLPNKLNDYILSINYDFPAKYITYTGSILYNISDNSDGTDNGNYFDYTIGISYEKSDFNFTLLYLNDGSYRQDTNAYENIDFEAEYYINNNYYFSVTYSKDIINGNSYDMYIGLGVSFE